MGTVTFACNCGQTHSISTKVLIGADILNTPSVFAEVVAGYIQDMQPPRLPVLVVADTNTIGAAGDKVLDGLRLLGDGIKVGKVILSPDGSHERVEPDHDQVFRLFEAVNPGREGLIVSIGSGSITDLSRFVAHRCGQRHIAVATAASMDGYTSSVAPLLYKGFKRTYGAKAPDSVVADSSVLSKAPREMTLAGWGDLVGKYTANADWVVANLAFGEYRCSYCWELLDRALAKCRSNLDSLGKGEPDAVEALAQGLIDSGLAISYAGCSRPASGAEHLISHVWEMMALRRGKTGSLHGTQVGIATVIISRLYERILAWCPTHVDWSSLESGHSVRDDADNKALLARLSHVVGDKAACEAINETGDRDKSWSPRRDRLMKLIDVWPQIVKGVRDILPETADIVSMLKRTGAPTSPEEIGLGPEAVVTAIRTAPYIRNRYTAINLADDLGILDGFLREMV